MKYIISILFICAFSLDGNAKKRYYPIEVMAGMADLIVIGEIHNVKSNSYRFKIKETIHGSASELIKVEMFKEWTCDHRAKEAEVGQELILFLMESGNKYEILNGSTGEIFIENGIVQRAIGDEKPLVSELVEAVQIFTSSYRYKGDYFDPINEFCFIQIKKNREIEELSKTSNLTKWFFDRMKDYKIEK